MTDINESGLHEVSVSTEGVQEQQSNPSHSVSKKVFGKLLLLSSVTLFLVVALLIVRATFFGSTKMTIDGKSIKEEVFVQNEKKLSTILSLTYHGNYVEASKEITKVFSDEKSNPTLTPDQLFSARRELLVKYRATGVPRDSIEAVNEIKKTVFDERMPMRKRADSLTTLANSVCWFGRSQEVFDVIFNDPAFSKYGKEDPVIANRDLLLLSYEKYTPTPKTAASLAYWYSDQVILNDLITKKLDAKTRSEYITEAKKYINAAKVLSDIKTRKHLVLSM